MGLTAHGFFIVFATYLSARSQVFGWIDRFALATDLKVQFDTIGIARPHLGYFLPLAHGLVFLHQQSLIVGVCA